MRYLTESYLSIAVCALLNVKTLKWSGMLSAIDFCNVFSILITIFMSLFPIAMIVFYTCKIKQWNEEEF